MIAEFVDKYMNGKEELRKIFEGKHPDNYKDVVAAVVSLLDGDDYGNPSKDRIHEINDGDYQGTLVYIIGANGYQPSDYWFVKVSYGSCSGCDTLDAIKSEGSYEDEKPNKEQVDQYMTLALHIIQGLKSMQVE